MHDGLPPGITLISAENLESWLMDIQILDDNPIYKGQTYRLKFCFSQSYPIGTLPAPPSYHAPLLFSLLSIMLTCYDLGEQKPPK